MEPRREPRRLCFFLGGHDLEMRTIAQLLRARVAPRCVFDSGLRWGAKASDYALEINKARFQGLVPVLVELEPDIALPPEAILVDHHGPRAGREQPTALEQVFALLGLAPECWTRWHEMVAANDRGYLPEMLARGATLEEMREIRAADRAAQGVTTEQEAQARAAVAHARSACHRRLTVIDLPHAKTTAAADFMEPLLGGPGYRNLLVGHPEGVTFYGDGAWIERLHQHFPEGWFGGGLPERGYWGSRRSPDEVLAFLESTFSESPGEG